MVIVARPIVAALAYAKDLEWQAQFLTVWQIGDRKYKLLEPKDFYQLLFRVKEHYNCQVEEDCKMDAPTRSC